MPENIEKIDPTVNDSKFDQSKYKVEMHQYPIDLGESPSTNKYGNHKVVFFINVQGGGKIVTNKELPVIDLPPSRYKTHSGDKLKELLGSKTSVPVIETEEAVYDPMGNVTGYVKKTNKDDIESASEFIKAKDKIFAPKKRLQTAISLYIPESLNKGYSVNWGEASGEDMANKEALAQAFLGVTNTKGIGASLMAGAAPLLSNTAAKFLNGQQYLQKAAGVSPGNSKAEQLFQSVDFNSFSFDYRFAPRSEKEADIVLNIIRTFRHHMLPEYFSETDFLYIYPSEFEIRYYYKDRENDYLERHMTAVLKNMTINYNPNGQFMTFKNGMPTHINVTLTFQELAVPTKKTSPYDRPGA